jgi:methylisocitrate lyase
MTSGSCRTLRQLLAGPGLIVAPVCFDPLTARLVEETGYACAALGGYALGAHLAVSEPLLTMSELVEAARKIAASSSIPLIVDAGTGYGDPLHIMRTIRELERVGVAAAHIEDQVFPKRAHYHRDYREHTIGAEEMVARIRYACQARQDPDFVIIARTDTMRTNGYAEGVRRAQLYAEAGADMVMLFPNDAEEAARAPRDCGVPLIYVNSAGNRVGRPVLSTGDLESMGYKAVADAISLIIAAYAGAREALERLRATGRTGIDAQRAIATRQAIERTIGLEEFYRIEEETVEAGPAYAGTGASHSATSAP